MSKITALITFLSLFSFISSAAVRRKKRDAVINKTVPKWTYEPTNFPDKFIDVVLRDPSKLDSGRSEYISTNISQSGLIEMFLPGTPESVFVCFPQNTEDYRQAYILSHVICRQLGFMTFASMNRRLSEEALYLGLKPNSFSCTGTEQNVSHCEWDHVNISSCKIITELTCGDCQHALKDFAGFLEVPGYPFVNLYDVTCEWDLIIDEDHSISLSFHHFESLFARSSKLFCNLHQPYMDIMYGRKGQMSYHRYCNLRDMENMTIPHGRVKIKIFTGLRNDVEGKGVAISFEAKTAETTSNWWWKIAFVTLFLLIFIIISALFHYCKKYGICDVQRNNILPTVNGPPTLADIDRAYEFQRCTIQKPLKEKLGLRLRSNGSGEKGNRSLSFTNETFMVDSVENCNLNLIDDPIPHIYNETPRNALLPDITITCASDDQMDAIEQVRVNLVDRYSRHSSDMSSTSSRVSTASPVFFPSRQSFQIYRSVSSDTDNKEEKKPPPYESEL